MFYPEQVRVNFNQMSFDENSLKAEIKFNLYSNHSGIVLVRGRAEK